MTQRSIWITTLLTGLAVFSSTAMATTGYFGLGYGAKAMGMAGAVVSNPQDALAAATNPAGMALVGRHVDASLRYFSPKRKTELETSKLGASFDVEDESRSNLFLIPNFGYNDSITERLWWGVTMYANGGMNTTYDRNLYDETAAVVGAATLGIPSPPAPAPIPPGPGAAAFVPKGTSTKDFGLPVSNVDTLGVDLKQAIFAPTLSFKLTDKHNIGASLLIGVQSFKARGLGNFQCFTKSVAKNPANAGTCPAFAAVPSKKLTNNGTDWSYGAGVRIGWIGELHPRLTVGAAAASKVHMTEFDDYEELFAEQGAFDIPANATLGLTFKVTPKLDVSFDFQRIFYEGVDSLSNDGPVYVSGVGGPAIPSSGDYLGTNDGLGFGWQDINVYRLGAVYSYSNEWTFRAGVSYNDQPIDDDQLLFNILAPAVVQRHVTAGFTYAPDAHSEFSLAYMHAFKEDVKSDKTAFGAPYSAVPGKTEMYQNSLDISYSYHF
jgi:long-chain fatty acid transport protein